MKTYNCTCGQLIFFDNFACVNCKRELGFLPDQLAMSSIDPDSDGLWRPNRMQKGRPERYRKCLNNAKENVCNWMVHEDSPEQFCVSCRLNETIPDLSQPENRPLWALAEAAKRRLVYSLLRLKLPVISKTADPSLGFSFRFLADVKNPDGSTTKVLTGHSDGVITLNIAEADDAHREKVRKEMREPYRTLLGHFRHEIGHYYWERLVDKKPFLDAFRERFGDERANYEQSLETHYAKGAPANWQENFISAYATSHPWEDWAETWAHFIHIQDTLEVANDFGLVGKRIFLTPSEEKAAYREPLFSQEQITFDGVIQAWSELAVALNSMNRSMGLSDLYPFVLSPSVIDKLRFVYELVVGNVPARAQAAALQAK
jgi:hypothetical protein